MYNKRNIYLNRFLSFILIFSIIFSMSSFFAVHADEIENDNAGASITYIDEEGNRHDSDKSANYFLAMLENESGVSPYMIPTEDDNSVKITNVVTKTLTKEQARTEMKAAVRALGSLAWIACGGGLWETITNAIISESRWKNVVVGYMTDFALDSLVNVLVQNPLSIKTYLYKSWSNYSNCYIVYQCIIYYTDTSMSTVKSVDYWQVRTENYAVAI